MNETSETLERVIELAGGRPAVARLVGVSKQAVYKWKTVPPEHCLTLEAALAGKVSRHQMRPDIFGPAEHAA